MAARGGAISGFACRITRSATSRFWSPGRVRPTLSWFPGPSVRSTSRTLADTLGFRRSKAGSWCRILRDARNLWRGHSCPRKARSESGLGVGTDRGQTQKQSQKKRQRTGVSSLHGLAIFWRRPRLPQSLPSLYSFVRAGIALDDVLQFLYALVLFSEFQQRVSLFELSGGSLVSAGKILQNQIVVRDRLFVIGGFELNFG